MGGGGGGVCGGWGEEEDTQLHQSRLKVNKQCSNPKVATCFCVQNLGQGCRYVKWYLYAVTTCFYKQSKGNSTHADYNSHKYHMTLTTSPVVF